MEICRGLRPDTLYASWPAANRALPMALSRYAFQLPRPIKPISTPRYLYCFETWSTPSPSWNGGRGAVHWLFVPQTTTSDLPEIGRAHV